MSGTSDNKGELDETVELGDVSLNGVSSAGESVMALSRDASPVGRAKYPVAAVNSRSSGLPAWGRATV